MLPKNIAELKVWDAMHVDLIGIYSKSIRQQKPGGAIINNNFSLLWMMIIYPDTGWFVIVEVLMYDLDEVMGGNDEYIYKSFARVSEFFNETFIIRYICP